MSISVCIVVVWYTPTDLVVWLTAILCTIVAGQNVSGKIAYQCTTLCGYDYVLYTQLKYMSSVIVSNASDNFYLL